MGQGRNAVVDEELRVRGLEGLRVSDASVIPTALSANTHAPTVMIAERTAHMILSDWRIEHIKRSNAQTKTTLEQNSPTQEDQTCNKPQKKSTLEKATLN